MKSGATDDVDDEEEDVTLCTAEHSTVSVVELVPDHQMMPAGFSSLRLSPKLPKVSRMLIIKWLHQSTPDTFEGDLPDPFEPQFASIFTQPAVNKAIGCALNPCEFMHSMYVAKTRYSPYLQGKGQS